MRLRTICIATLACLSTLGASASTASGQTNFLTDALGAMPGDAQGKAWWAGTCDLFAGAAETGTAPATPRDCLDFGTFNSQASPNAPSPWQTPPAWRMAAAPGAATHPDGTAGFAVDVEPAGGNGYDEPLRAVKTINVNLPPGVVGNPTVVPECTLEQFAASPHQCPPASQVGVTSLRLSESFGASPVTVTEVHPVYSLEPRAGYTAEFGIPDIAVGPDITGIGSSIRIFAKARTDGDFGVTAGVMAVPTTFPLVAQMLTFWGVPWAASHDLWRPLPGTSMPPGGVALADQAHYDPSWGPIKPFFSNPSECDPANPPATQLIVDSYEEPARLIPEAISHHSKIDATDPRWLGGRSTAPVVSGCSGIPFDPDIDIQPTSAVADAPSGLDVGLDLPQNNDPPAPLANDPDDATGAPSHWSSAAGRATAHLDKAVVALPPGFSVNPSAASGLVGCTDDQIGVTALGNPPLFDDLDPFDGKGSPAEGTECPDGSKIGTVEAQTPLLDERLTGELVLGQPKPEDVDCPGQPGVRRGDCPLTVRLFLVLRNEERDLLAKVYGTTVTDPTTGRLTATFDNNPRVPVERIELDVRGGDRGMIALPQRCAEHAWNAVFTPWTAAHGGGGVDVPDTDTVALNQRCAFGFAPGLAAGMDTRRGGAHGSFSFRFARQDGEQWFEGLTADLPGGLLASVKGVPLCTNAQAAAGSCPAGSRLGKVDAGAGSGAPFFLERPGDIYLTEGYKGCAYGLMVRVPVEAGPFRGDVALTPIVVRQAVCVDPTDAHVRAVSDPFPEIWHGVPLRVREVTVTVDRPAFMLNPSSCEPKRIRALLSSTEGAAATPTQLFQATECDRLRFAPKLALRLTGRKQVRTGRHPGVKATVNQTGIGEAGIRKAVVRLPKSLALDPDNAQALCEFEDGTKADIERHCPKGSIVGRARAVTPLLDRPLVGNVYFVKNVRRSSSGNLIRTLPMIVVALRGEIAINLKGKSSTTNAGKLVNTFAAVPDAPISRFNLNVAGGKSGILAVTRTRRGLINLCAKPRSHVAEADMDGQNGKRRDFDVRMKTPCKKPKQRPSKRRGVRRS